MEGNNYKIVEFNKYCKFCKYGLNKEIEEPCDECLQNPVNVDSHCPVFFKPDSGKYSKDDILKK